MSTTILQIETILSEIIDHLIAYEDQRAAQQAQSPSKLVVMNLGDLLDKNLDAIELDEWEDNPVGRTLRHGVTRLGKKLYKATNGDLDQMREVLERVADRHPNRYQRVASIIDNAWNEVGEGENKWWA